MDTLIVTICLLELGNCIDACRHPTKANTSTYGIYSAEREFDIRHDSDEPTRPDLAETSQDKPSQAESTERKPKCVRSSHRSSVDLSDDSSLDLDDMTPEEVIDVYAEDPEEIQVVPETIEPTKPSQAQSSRAKKSVDQETEFVSSTRRSSVDSSDVGGSLDLEDTTPKVPATRAAATEADHTKPKRKSSSDSLGLRNLFSEASNCRLPEARDFRLPQDIQQYRLQRNQSWSYGGCYSHLIGIDMEKKKKLYKVSNDDYALTLSYMCRMCLFPPSLFGIE